MLEQKSYKVKIIGSYTGESPEKKTPFFALELETECGQFIDWVQYITDGNKKIGLQSLVNAGFIGKKLSDLSNPKLAIEDLFSEEDKLTAVIEHEEWTDDEGEIKHTPKVKWLNNGSSGPAKAEYKDAVKMFAGKSFDGMLKELQGKVKTKSTKTKSEPAEERAGDDLTDDDVPF